MSDAELRKYMGQLLKGKFRTDNLMHLLLALRGRAPDRSLTRELGDFVAHRDARDRGHTHAILSDAVIAMRFGAFQLAKEMDMQNIPADFDRAMQINLRNSDPNILRMRTGLSQIQAKKRLASVISSKYSKVGCVWRQITPLTHEEWTFLSSLNGIIPPRYAFRDSELCDDIWGLCHKIGIVEKEDAAEFSRLRPLITIYAVARMHGAEIKIKDADSAYLFAGVDSADGRLFIGLETEVVQGNGAPFTIISGAFETSLVAVDWCDSALAATFRWEHPVTIDDPPRLIPL